MRTLYTEHNRVKMSWMPNYVNRKHLIISNNYA